MKNLIDICNSSIDFTHTIRKLALQLMNLLIEKRPVYCNMKLNLITENPSSFPTTKKNAIILGLAQWT